jgi:hypothetical protein
MLGDGTSGAIQKLVIARPGEGDTSIWFNLLQLLEFLWSELVDFSFSFSLPSAFPFIRSPWVYLCILEILFNTFLFISGKAFCSD